MPRHSSYHPRAYLTGVRNVARGLSSRTKIINAVEDGKHRVSEISKKAGLSRSCVRHHLKLLSNQKVVVPKRMGRALSWSLTKYGQERLFG